MSTGVLTHIGGGEGDGVRATNDGLDWGQSGADPPELVVTPQGEQCALGARCQEQGVGGAGGEVRWDLEYHRIGGTGDAVVKMQGWAADTVGLQSDGADGAGGADRAGGVEA